MVIFWYIGSKMECCRDFEAEECFEDGVPDVWTRCRAGMLMSRRGYHDNSLNLPVIHNLYSNAQSKLRYPSTLLAKMPASSVIFVVLLMLKSTRGKVGEDEEREERWRSGTGVDDEDDFFFHDLT